MTAKRILAVLGVLIMALGVLMVFRPRATWEFWQNLLVGYLYTKPPATVYVVGTIGILLGLFMLYVGLRRLTRFSPLIWIVGALTTATSLMMVLAPEFMRDVLNSLFYFRSDTTKIILSYIGGVIRFFIGVLFVIAGLTRKPEQQESAPAVTEIQSPS